MPSGILLFGAKLLAEGRPFAGLRMATSRRPALRVTWIRDDRVNDEARYRVQVFGKDARVFDVRISLTAKAQSKPAPEEKIEEWFKRNPLSEAGSSEKIPDQHFLPSNP